MTSLLKNRVTIVWLGLVLATMLSWWLGTDHGFTGADGRTIGTAIVLAVAFLKIRFIGMHFMELRTAPLVLRIVFEGWVVGVGGVVLALYLAGQ